MSVRSSTSPNSQYPTIALLTSWISDTVIDWQWNGMVNAARRNQANLITYVGGVYNAPSQERHANAIYELPKRGQVDGLVIWAGNMLWRCDEDDVHEFIHQFTNKVVISSEKTVEGVTSLLLDDYDGMRQAVKHLIDVHNRRRIIFIRGPLTHQGAEERYRAYCDSLADADISLDPTLVTTPLKDWSEDVGVSAFDSLGLTPGEDYDAIVSVNSSILFSVVRILQQQGVEVPEQVSVVGFGDVLDNLIYSPSLTTVLSPFYEMGQQAVDLLLASLRGDALPTTVLQPTRLLIRRSCGCVEKIIADAALPGRHRHQTAVAGGMAALAGQKEAWIQSIQQAILSQVSNDYVPMDVDDLSSYVRSLVDAFLIEVNDGVTGFFLKTVSDLLYQVMEKEGDVSAWQASISVLRQFIFPHVDSKNLLLCENLWNQGRVLISEMTERTQLNRLLRHRSDVDNQHEIATVLNAESSIDGVLNSLAGLLPRLEIPGCYIAFYVDPEKPLDDALLMLAYTDGERLALPPDGLRFPASELFPAEFSSAEQPVSLVVEPLYSQDVSIGYVVFQLGPVNSRLYETLRLQLSNTLHRVKFTQAEIEERRRAEQALRSEQYFFQSIMDNVPEKIYFKDQEGRFIRVNKAMAKSFGVNAPTDLDDKTDFDIFTDEHAQPAFDVEQHILQTGEPVFDLEEKEVFPDGREEWVSTSKLPLIDENGQIIGTFGISRNITASKRAEDELAYERDLLRALMNNVPDHIFFKDRQSHIIRSNLAHAKWLGFDKPEQLVGKTDFDLLAKEIAQPLFDEEQRVMESGQPLIGRVARMTNDDNETLWFSETKLPMRDANGTVVGLIGISRDITSLKQVEEVLEHRSVQLETAAEVARYAGSILDPSVLIQQAVNLIQERFELYYVGLFLVDEDGEWTNEPGRWAVLRAGTGDAGQQMLSLNHKLEIGETSMIGWCLQHAQARIALDVGEDALRFRNPHLPQTRSELALPLITRGKALGALSIQSSQEAAFSEEDITIFQIMVDQLSNAIANARLYEEIQGTLQEMQATTQRYLRQGWQQYTDTRKSSGYVQDEDGVRPLGDKLLPEIHQAVNELRSVTLSSASDDSSSLVVPIVLRGQPIGAVGFRSENPEHRWRDDEIAVIEVLTEQFALAAENLRLLDETQRRAERERLTADITSHMRETLNLETILKTTVEEIQQALNLPEVVVHLKPSFAEPVDDVSSSSDGNGKDAENL